MSYTVNNISIQPPSGCVVGFLGTVDPSGWVIANGVSRINVGQYNYLLTLGIGTGTPGSNIASTTYNPPNYNGAFLRGINGSGNYIGPTSVNTNQSDSFASHNHAVSDPGHNHSISDPGHHHLMPGGGTNFSGGSGHTTTTDNNGSANNNNVETGYTGVTSNIAYTGIGITNTGGTETRPYNFGVNWIIKL